MVKLIYLYPAETASKRELKEMKTTIGVPRYVIKLWPQHDLDQDSFAFGNLESFLRKLFRHFGIKFK